MKVCAVFVALIGPNLGLDICSDAYKAFVYVKGLTRTTKHVQYIVWEI